MSSAGVARAYWSTGPDEGALRPEDLPEPGPDDALVRTLWSGISRGTELLVRRGLVPESQTQRMRAPFQAGDFPFPVKYGYLSVGVVERGPTAWRGRRVFCLHPHQDRYVVPVSALAPIPDGVPSRRAILAGTVETALNALWDAPPCFGDRVAVVGGGLVGGALALLLRGFPLGRLQVVEVDDDARRRLSAQGLDVVVPDAAAGDCDLVFHVSASEPGLELALGLLGDEAELVELSWFGASSPRVPLGEDFHARRLRVTASQVGRVGRSRRHRRDLPARMATALTALTDPAFDVLIGADVDFADVTEAMAELGRTGSGGCVAVAYPDAPTDRT